MVWFVIAGCLALAAVFIGFARLAPDPSRRRIRGERIAHRYRLYVDPEDVAAFDRLLDRERRARYVLLTAFIVVFGGVGVIGLATDFPDGAVLVGLFAAAVPVTWVAAVLTTGAEAAPNGLPGPGAATLVHPAIWAGLGAAALVGMATATWAARSPSPWADPATVALALVPGWGVVVAGIGARLVARRPLADSRAGWRYAALAMRSESLTNACSSTILFGCLALAQALEQQDAFGLALAVLITMCAFSLVSAFPRLSHLYFRERLWPELPRRDVVSTAAVRLP